LVKLKRLSAERVSRFHAKVQFDNGEVILTDLESTNGTRVNGNVVQIRMPIMKRHVSFKSAGSAPATASASAHPPPPPPRPWHSTTAYHNDLNRNIKNRPAIRQPGTSENRGDRPGKHGVALGAG
jgi:hypothetical protein